MQNRIILTLHPAGEGSTGHKKRKRESEKTRRQKIYKENGSKKNSNLYRSGRAAKMSSRCCALLKGPKDLKALEKKLKHKKKRKRFFSFGKVLARKKNTIDKRLKVV